jgi:hypothetical protein
MLLLWQQQQVMWNQKTQEYTIPIRGQRGQQYIESILKTELNSEHE